MPPDQSVALHQSIKIVCPSTSPKRVAEIVTRGIPHNIKFLKNCLRNHQHHNPKSPPELGKSEQRLASRANNVGFFQACVEAREPHELNQLPPNPHPAAALLYHMRVHGVRVWRELIKLVGFSCFYTCLEKPYIICSTC